MAKRKVETKSDDQKFKERVFEVILNKAVLVYFYEYQGTPNDEIIAVAGMSCVPRVGDSVRIKDRVGHVLGVQWEPELQGGVHDEFEILEHVNKARVWLKFT